MHLKLYIFECIMDIIENNKERRRIMEELVKLVSQKTGISTDQARTAVETVLGFLKQKLPAPVAAQIDGLLAGGNMPDLTKGVGGLFGK
jgi:hypothetical protein